MNFPLTNSERERLHYIGGRPKLANLFADLCESDEINEAAEDARDSVNSAISMLPEEDFMEELQAKFKTLCTEGATVESLEQFGKDLEELSNNLNTKFDQARFSLGEAINILT